jgi:D-alanyl-lipoteichoic acid acyltransferase DltB (MBOAT superfamily)
MVFASFFFYSWWNILYLPLILGSILFNFIVGSTLSKMDGTQPPLKKSISRKTLLAFALISNILLLGYFKYMDFFITNSNLLIGTRLDLLHIVLPLGISFFTFTQIAYLVDTYRNEVKEMDYLNYTLFVTFFPHLLAGPILHHKEMMPQFDSLKNKVINYRNISAGLFLFSIGLFKKIVIADTFAGWANTGFDTASTLNFLEAWATSLSYTFQLYFDFSGYTDMALGVALMFNIKLPINFNSPYKALSIQDFWRRWHITLSRFLRDYIYIPLGGNRKGELHTYANLFTVFLIGGLWHGASWMFVIWGALHGFAIVIHRAWQQMGLSMHKWLAWFITFNFVNIAWIFFRAKDWEQVTKIVHGMVYGDIIFSDKLENKFFFLKSIGIEFGQFMMHLGGSASTWVWIICVNILILIAPNSGKLTKDFKPSKFILIAITILLVDALIHLSKNSEFLYFNF